MNTEDQDEQFMRKALVEAQAAFDEGEIPVGAIVVCRGRIISRAHNLTETLTDVTAHAEMQAITAAANALGGKYLTDCTLYVTVEPPLEEMGKKAAEMVMEKINNPEMENRKVVLKTTMRKRESTGEKED